MAAERDLKALLARLGGKLVSGNEGLLVVVGQREVQVLSKVAARERKMVYEVVLPACVLDGESRIAYLGRSGRVTGSGDHAPSVHAVLMEATCAVQHARVSRQRPSATFKKTPLVEKGEGLRLFSRPFCTTVRVAHCDSSWLYRNHSKRHRGH